MKTKNGVIAKHTQTIDNTNPYKKEKTARLNISQTVFIMENLFFLTYLLGPWPNPPPGPWPNPGPPVGLPPCFPPKILRR